MSLTILNATASLFVVLFLFMMFIFISILLSLFAKKTKTDYKPEITVVIPAYNEEKNIELCINSIKKSTYPKEKIRIIVVDDGSTDKTREIVKRHKDIMLLEQNHKGKTDALNLAVKYSKTEIIVTVDADTIVDRDCIAKLVNPLKEKDIGATTGTTKVKTQKTMWQAFQGIEYNFNNLIRKAFTKTFKNGIWFFGVLAAYKKTALKKVGYFKKDTLTEDMDIALELYKKKYRTLHVYDAMSHTEVPGTFMELYRQRSRWWIGVLQALKKNKLFKLKENASINFLYLNQYWWTFYSIFAIPVLIYHFMYWLPYNLDTLPHTIQYIVNWFTLIGPFYVIYKIPEWGLNFYSIFAVSSGIISALCIVIAQYTFKEGLKPKSVVAIIFYFPYTIALNIIIVLSLIKSVVKPEKYFKK